MAEPGQTVALLGTTGAGKSSLVHLIPRFYDVTGGRVTSTAWTCATWIRPRCAAISASRCRRRCCSAAPSATTSATAGPRPSDEEVVAAAKAAQAHDFITRFPEGYDTVLGQRGVNLSGGQKQRIAIARALLIKPAVLILDDSTSSVDVETETKIQTELESGCANELRLSAAAHETCFVIAQRISTVLNADKILVLDDGRIAAEGTHSELLATSPIYREIYDSQLGDGARSG